MFTPWFKKLSIVVVSFLTFSSYAQATNVTLSYGKTDLLVSVNRDADVSGPFNFTDIFDLDLTVPASFSFLISELEEPAYNIVNGSFTYALYDISDNILSTPSILSPGAYQLRVSGTADGFFGGQYYLSLNVTPVPELESTAMILLGLSVMGLIARRKS